KKDPAKNVRPGQPVNVAGGQHGTGESAGQQEISPDIPIQAKPQPDTRSDRESVEHGNSGEPGGLMNRAHQNIGQPLPCEPRLTCAGKREGIALRKTTGTEDHFPGSDVPTGIRIAEEGGVAL